ncbi:1-aminocyclopropane-1-carboxylate deaminase/D-cysteine desulfhydrase [Candidatus Colwellia aromaticivorans]|uniref:1-aminocyclopropane-1-carboxylate deaminase/D-cysteine desulfhydrase n=1 Tax=Candidatus Colwellia aromaticivorans TaxID=2267621 RepID=UPI000DF16B6A|nr:pyridoxal-phosphate dependent enzyme [Candidatus Colwellia aromaticivorans]
MTILSELQPLFHPLFNKHKVQVEIKRDDIIHTIISGNKWRKLKFNLQHVKQAQKFNGVLSFGGCYSNHIHALAFACCEQNIPCVGIIRGEVAYADNFTLSWAKHWGMKLHFVDRKTYRRRHDNDYLKELQQQFPHYFIVPEGGTNKLAITGVSEIITELTTQTEFDTLITPVGSGGTIAGLIVGDALNNATHKILGIAVLKNAKYLENEIKHLLPTAVKTHNNWQLLTEFHRGGYAKFSPNDIARIVEFNQVTGVEFEPVYSGKMILAFLDLLEQGYFRNGERIVLLHTGGMQGLGGMIERGILNAEDWPMPERVASSE